jgi:hypothetical protein
LRLRGPRKVNAAIVIARVNHRYLIASVLPQEAEWLA